MHPVKRGANIQGEMEHAELLLDRGAEDIWGWGSPSGQRRVERRVRFILEELRPGPGKCFLECGCGTGVFTRRIAQSGARIVAVDVAASLIAEAKKHAPDTVDFVVGNLMDGDLLRDSEFDGFYCVSVLHHLNMDEALPVIASRLKKGARFAVSEPNMDNPICKYVLFTPDLEKRARHGISPTEMAFTREELKESLERHGFAIDRLEYRDFLHPRIPRPLIPIFRLAGGIAERLPWVRTMSGSLWCSGVYSNPFVG